MLETYTQKRDFKRTAEPRGQRAQGAAGPLRFLVQKHTARALHYDFRLEVDGVLKSWPIPKGPSLDPSAKRLAVMTEDHPLEYATFEGVIPKGEYGGGEVIVWDAGVYGPLIDDEVCFDRHTAESAMRRGIDDGKLKIRLHGRKLRGVWTLVRTKKGDWLVLKRDDGEANPLRDLTDDDASVLTGLTNEDIKSGILPLDRTPEPFLPDPSLINGTRKRDLPADLKPMLPSLTERAFSHPDWLFEPKLDGLRLLAQVKDGKVRLSSRRGIDSTHEYDWLVDALKRQPWNMVLDGELVVLDERGRPSFQAWQDRGNENHGSAMRFYAFDLLFADGYDLRGARLEDRKRLLDLMLVPSERARTVEWVEAEGEALFHATRALDIEGMVAKRKDSLYEAGKRSTRWLKMKHVQTEDFVIGGYTAGLGHRTDSLGSLLLGTPTEKKGVLRFVGHVGSGFDDKGLRAVTDRLEALRSDSSPFDAPVPLKGRWSKKDRGAPRWVRPELVAEVKFAERTNEDILRAPVFLRLRDDLEASTTRPQPAVSAPDSKPSSQNAGPLDSVVTDVLGQLKGSKQTLTVRVGEHEIGLSSLDKALWPAYGRNKSITKRDLAQYLVSVAPSLLPFLKNRPITLVRYPNGLDGQHFYQRHWEHALPPFVETVTVYTEHGGGDADFLMCNNLQTLVWLAQMGTLEIHPWYSRASLEPDALDLPLEASGSDRTVDRSVLNYPDFLVFDLDPYQYSGKEAKGAEPELHRAGFQGARQVALWLKELLDGMKLPSYVKTTGKTGLHIYVPIVRNMAYHETHAFCRALSEHLVAQHPDIVTTDWAVQKRRGKIFADYNQNVRGKTLASMLCPRAMAEAAVSMPIRWSDLEDGDVYPTQFSVRTAVKYLKGNGNSWADIMESKVDLNARLSGAQDKS
jgi:bifunctional non-homologous end joining protein LigD